METNKILDSLENDPDIQFLKNEYPDVWRPVGKAITEVATNAEKRIEVLSEKVERQGKQRLYDDLDRNVENWEVINVSPEFGQWLEQEHSYSGFTRKQLLLSAYQNHDSEIVQNFFDDFKKETASNMGNANQHSDRDRDNPQPELIKSSEVKKFYEDVQRGRYVGAEEARQGEEARIEKAVIEGRIV